MAYTEFYCDAATGSNVNAGDKTANGVVQSTNGAWSTITNIFTATGGTPFSGVSVGDFCALMADGGTIAVYVAKVSAIGGGGLTLTLDGAFSAGTAPTTAGIGITATTGGAWKGPNGAVNFPFNFVVLSLRLTSSTNVRVNFKNNSTYTITAAVAHSNTGQIVFQGYTTSPGDGGKAVLSGDFSGGTFPLFSVSGVGNEFTDLIFTNNATSGADALVSITARGNWRRCVVHDSYGPGFSVGAGNVTLVECEAYLCNKSNTTNSGGFNHSTTANALYIRCVSHDNSAGSNCHGFIGIHTTTNRATYINCISDTNAGSGFRHTSTGVTTYLNCISYNNANQGIDLASNGTAFVESCILVSNGSYGVNGTTTSGSCQTVVFSAFYSNTSGQTNAVQTVENSVTLTGDPFTAASTGNFILNNTASAGAACRGTGRGAFTETQASYTGTVGYPDIGAAQHQDSGGGGTTYFLGNRTRIHTRNGWNRSSRTSVIAGQNTIVRVPLVVNRIRPYLIRSNYLHRVFQPLPIAYVPVMMPGRVRTHREQVNSIVRVLCPLPIRYIPVVMPGRFRTQKIHSFRSNPVNPALFQTQTNVVQNVLVSTTRTVR